MTSDLQADLDALADAIEVVAELVGGEHGRALDDRADRLRHLLDDRGIDQAPYTSEIIAWLEADPDHVVDAWNADLGRCTNRGRRMDLWRARLCEHGDQRQYGYRLGVRQPATERVRLDQVIGRTLPGKVAPVRRVAYDTSVGLWRAWAFDGLVELPFDLDVAPDGTVEVLRVDP